MTRFLSFFLLSLLGFARVNAQQLAYIYIQGDKQTPFYVKLEGAMQERYGKNYCILSQMAPGPAHLEILFQQNVFPAQSFTIQVPEGGSRGFMLVQKDGAFSLYDLQQNFYLPAGNKEEDDHLPQKAVVPIVVARRPVAEEEVSKAGILKKEKRTPPVKKKAVVRKEKVVPAKNSGDPQFIGNIELHNGGNNAGAAPVLSNDSGFAPPVTLAPTFRNSDCPQAVDSATFDHLYKQMIAKSTDEERIDFLNGQMDKCYLTFHARTLGSMLTEDAARFTFLKKVYPRITDQQQFPLLDDLLRSEVWKAQFTQLVHP